MYFDGKITSSDNAANTARQNDIEKVLAEIWGSTLGVDEVTPEDNFLLLGGESLLAIQAAVAAKEKLGCEISIRSIFTSTIKEIAMDLVARS